MRKRTKQPVVPPAPPPPPPTPEELAESKKRMMETQKQRLIDNAQSAVKCMRDFVENAQRRIDDVVAQPDRLSLDGEPFYFLGLPEQILHELAWGMANSSSRLQCAMSASIDFLRLERLP